MDGVHLIDRMLWVFGADVESVSASMGNPVYTEVPADDTSMAFMRWCNDKVTTVSWIAYRTGVTSTAADFFCTNDQVRFRIGCGGQGTTSVWVGNNEEYTEVDVPQFNSRE